MQKKTLTIKTQDILDVKGIDLSPKKRDFARHMAGKNISAGKAYAKASGRDKATPSDYVSASRLLQDAKVRQAVENFNDIYKGLAEWALEKQIELALDSKTSPTVKNAIFESLQNKAGHGQTQKIETTKKMKYPEYNMSPEQLHDMIEEAKRNPENSALDALLVPTAKVQNA